MKDAIRYAVALACGIGAMAAIAATCLIVIRMTGGAW